MCVCVCVSGLSRTRVFPYDSLLPGWQEAIGLLKWHQLGTVRQLCPHSCASPCYSLSSISCIAKKYPLTYWLNRFLFVLGQSDKVERESYKQGNVSSQHTSPLHYLHTWHTENKLLRQGGNKRATMEPSVRRKHFFGTLFSYRNMCLNQRWVKKTKKKKN